MFVSQIAASESEASASEGQDGHALDPADNGNVLKSEIS